MAPESPPPIRLLCDRCRAEGAPGDDHFASLGDLLDFEPVPRKQERVDGWTPDRQRAFIAALAATGSPRRAAAAVGKAQWGAEQLRKGDGADGFNAAWEAALDIAREKGAHRLAAGINAVGAQDESWPRAARPWSGAATRAAPPGLAGRGIRPKGLPQPETPEEDTAQRIAFLKGIVSAYQLKLEAEHEARIAGRFAEADFYLRQVTWLEVALDLGSGDGFAYLHRFRAEGHHLAQIATTPVSELLDAARRDHWRNCGDPPRPDHPLKHLLVDHGRFSTEPNEFTVSGVSESHEEQRRKFAERHAEDAKRQVEWEAEARREHERRRQGAAAHGPGEPPDAAAGSAGGEQGKAGRPAASPTGPTSRD